MDNFLNLINIKKEEAGKVLIFGLMLGIRTAGCTVGWAAVQAIIMKRLGTDSLPYSFIFFAIIGMSGALIYLLFADVIIRGTLLKIFCSVTGVLLIIAGIFLPSFGVDKTLTAGFIISCCLVLIGNGIGYSSTGIQIWTLINDTFTPCEGTRVYPVIATAPLIGSIAGGAILPLLLDTLGDSIGMKSLLVIWGLSVLAVLPLLELLRKYYGNDIISKATYLKNLKKSPDIVFSNLKEGITFCLRSPFIYVLSAICILFWTVASLKEFQYGIIMNKAFPTEGELSKFYASFTVYLHITVFIFQFLFTARIIRLTGVGRGFCILPVTIFLGILSILLSFSFYTGVAMRFTWDIAAMTVQGSIFQLAFNGVPGPYRGRVRGILEGFVNPIGGIQGGLLIIFINRFFYPVTCGSVTEHRVIITFLGLWFSILWIFVSIIMKGCYNNVTLKNLESEDRRTVFDAIEMLGELDKTVALKKYRFLLDTDDPEVKDSVLKAMETKGYTMEDINNLP